MEMHLPGDVPFFLGKHATSSMVEYDVRVAL